VSRLAKLPDNSRNRFSPITSKTTTMAPTCAFVVGSRPGIAMLAGLPCFRVNVVLPLLDLAAVLCSPP
jgi:hypothetical protein